MGGLWPSALDSAGAASSATLQHAGVKVDDSSLSTAENHPVSMAVVHIPVLPAAESHGLVVELIQCERGGEADERAERGGGATG